MFSRKPRRFLSKIIKGKAELINSLLKMLKLNSTEWKENTGWNRFITFHFIYICSPLLVFLPVDLGPQTKGSLLWSQSSRKCSAKSWSKVQGWSGCHKIEKMRHAASQPAARSNIRVRLEPHIIGIRPSGLDLRAERDNHDICWVDDIRR